MILASHGIIGSQIGQVDADALAFFARVDAATGLPNSLSATERTAVNTLVVKMKFDGIWNSMKAIYPMVGASAAACAQNLKSSSFTGTFTATGWTFASTGVTPNGASAFFDTNFVPSAELTTNSAHFSKYNRNNDLSGIKVDGCSNPNTSIFFQNNYTSANGAIGNISSLAVYTASNTTGLINTIRTSLSVLKVFRNSTNIANNTTTITSALPGNSVYIGARSDIGAPVFYNSYECAFASMGDGLTDTQASNFYTAVQNFNTTLNRQIAP